MKFECIKGMADTDNVNVVVMQGDVVKFLDLVENSIEVEGVAGWCMGVELSFTPKQFAEHFKVIGIQYVL
jgi:hypothetical protein